MNSEGRTNTWPVKCMPCITVCTRAFCGFVPTAAVNWLSAFIICFS